MISVNFDPVNNNIFTLVESKIEVNFGGATYEGGGGGATVANIIPSVDIDISAYGVVEYDAFQDWGGVEDPNFYIDVDVALNPDKTIYLLQDCDGTTVDYRFANVQVNKIYYFRLGNTYSMVENPIGGYGNIFHLMINGVDAIGGNGGVELEDPLDYSATDGTVMCFVITEPVTPANILSVLKFSYYKDDFRMLAPKYTYGELKSVKFSNYGRNLELRFNNQEFSQDATFGLRMNYTKQRIDVMPFNTVGNKRLSYIGSTNEEDWLINALGYKVSPDLDYSSGTSLYVIQGNQTMTLPNGTKILTKRTDNKVGYKGTLIIIPAGFAMAIGTGWIARPASEAFNSASSKVVIQWEAISDTEVLYELTNIA